MLKGCAVKCKKSPSTDTLQCSFDCNLAASAKKPENQRKYLHPIVAVLRPILNSLRQLRDEWMTNNGNTGQIPGYSAASVPATVTVLTANQLCCLLCLGKQPAATRCALVGAKHTQMVTETQWTIRTGWRFQKGWTNTSQWDGYNVCSLKTKKSHFLARKMKVMCFFCYYQFFTADILKMCGNITGVTGFAEYPRCANYGKYLLMKRGEERAENTQNALRQELANNAATA